jgi:hypothetical protein
LLFKKFIPYRYFRTLLCMVMPQGTALPEWGLHLALPGTQDPYSHNALSLEPYLPRTECTYMPYVGQHTKALWQNSWSWWQ